MREIRSSGSVGERGGNKPLYPETCRVEAEIPKTDEFEISSPRTSCYQPPINDSHSIIQQVVTRNVKMILLTQSLLDNRFRPVPE